MITSLQSTSIDCLETLRREIQLAKLQRDEVKSLRAQTAKHMENLTKTWQQYSQRCQSMEARLNALEVEVGTMETKLHEQQSEANRIQRRMRDQQELDEFTIPRKTKKPRRESDLADIPPSQVPSFLPLPNAPTVSFVGDDDDSSDDDVPLSSFLPKKKNVPTKSSKGAIGKSGKMKTKGSRKTK